jgi:hypothetical protein
VAVSVWPLGWLAAFQMLMICWLPGQVQVTFHAVMAVVPVLVTVMLAVKPVPQSFET